MIENVIDLPEGTIGFRASGKITSDEYRKMIEPIYATLERGEKLNIYFELTDDFHGLDTGALAQDVKAAGSIGLKHRSSWQRMALVTDKDWIRALERARWAGLLPASSASSRHQRQTTPALGWPRPRPTNAQSTDEPREASTWACGADLVAVDCASTANQPPEARDGRRSHRTALPTDIVTLREAELCVCPNAQAAASSGGWGNSIQASMRLRPVDRTVSFF